MFATPLRRAALTVTGVLLTLLMVLGLGAASTHPAMAATLGDTPAAMVSAEQAVPNEDEPGWNSCTMGNLGPCDLSSTLPNGGWFTVNVADISETPGVHCEGTLVPVRVTVAAVSGDGTHVDAHLAVTVCAARVAPPMAPEVSELLPGIFRVLAAHL